MPNRNIKTATKIRLEYEWESAMLFGTSFNLDSIVKDWKEKLKRLVY